MNEEKSSDRDKPNKRSASERKLIFLGAIVGGILSLLTLIAYKMTAGRFANNFHMVITYILVFVGGPFVGGLVTEIGIVQKAPRWLIFAIIGFLGLCFPLCLCSFSVMFMDQ